MKNKLITIVTVCMFLLISYTTVAADEKYQIKHESSPIVNSDYDDNRYVFENVYVKVYGRCRSIYSSGEWGGVVVLIADMQSILGQL